MARTEGSDLKLYVGKEKEGANGEPQSEGHEALNPLFDIVENDIEDQMVNGLKVEVVMKEKPKKVKRKWKLKLPEPFFILSRKHFIMAQESNVSWFKLIKTYFRAEISHFINIYLKRCNNDWKTHYFGMNGYCLRCKKSMVQVDLEPKKYKLTRKERREVKRDVKRKVALYNLRKELVNENWGTIKKKLKENNLSQDFMDFLRLPTSSTTETPPQTHAIQTLQETPTHIITIQERDIEDIHNDIQEFLTEGELYVKFRVDRHDSDVFKIIDSVYDGRHIIVITVIRISIPNHLHEYRFHEASELRMSATENDFNQNITYTETTHRIHTIMVNREAEFNIVEYNQPTAAADYLDTIESMAEALQDNGMINVSTSDVDRWRAEMMQQPVVRGGAFQYDQRGQPQGVNGLSINGICPICNQDFQMNGNGECRHCGVSRVDLDRVYNLPLPTRRDMIMRLRERLLPPQGVRGTGRTTRAIERCLAVDGIYIVHNVDFAQRLIDLHPTVRIELMNSLRFIENDPSEIFYDHYVTERFGYKNKNTEGYKESPKPKTFKLNDLLELRLENGKTKIYIAGKEFIKCKYLLLNLEHGNEYEDIESIDDAAKKLGADHPNRRMESGKVDITPEVEFWGHCSNLQAWVENDYDLRVIHSNLGFPLVKELIKHGDKKALSTFKEEMLHRIEKSGMKAYNTHEVDILKYFSEEEMEVIYDMIIPNREEYIKKIEEMSSKEFFEYITKKKVLTLSSPTEDLEPGFFINGISFNAMEFNITQEAPEVHYSTNTLEPIFMNHNPNREADVVIIFMDDGEYQQFSNNSRGEFEFRLTTQQGVNISGRGHAIEFSERQEPGHPLTVDFRFMIIEGDVVG